MSGAVQDIGNVAKAIGGDVGWGNTPAGGVGSSLLGAGTDLWNYLSAPAATSPTDANGQPTTPGGNFLRNISGPLGLAYGAFNAYQQQQYQNQLNQHKWQPLNPQMLAQAQQQVEGQIGGSLGSGGPIQLATGVMNADVGLENMLQQNYNEQLRQLGNMFPTYGGLGQIFASLYGTPQTGPYAKSTAQTLAGDSSSDADQMSANEFFNQPYYGMTPVSY